MDDSAADEENRTLRYPPDVQMSSFEGSYAADGVVAEIVPLLPRFSATVNFDSRGGLSRGIRTSKRCSIAVSETGWFDGVPRKRLNLGSRRG